MKHIPFLSKSQYMLGMQCHKYLYLHKHHKQLRDGISPAQQKIFALGTEVGVLAQDIFPGGIEVPYDGLSIDDQIKMTKDEIAGGAKTIYEASFKYDDVFVKVDILHQGNKGWELYEVKSSTSIKDVNYDDIALQYYVLAGAGISLSKACLVHINNQYVRNGDIEVGELFTINDLSVDVVEMQQDVPANIAEMRSMLEGDMPAIDIGAHCSDPYGCNFTHHCWQHIPENSVFDLHGRGVDKFDFYRQGKIAFADLPLDELNDSQRLQVKMHLTQGEIVDPDGIKEFLDNLWYPLCHFDLETFMSPIPLHDGMRPYQQIPFQYSLHIQRKEGGPIKHHEFLAEPNVDPRPQLIRTMLAQIPKDACVLTFNMPFEKSRLKEMSEDFPQYAEDMNNIRDHVMDLITPFRQRCVYRWQQHGSNSLKDVLPAFVPDMSYQGLEISDGSMAMDAYHLMCAETDQAKRQALCRNLLQYCERDTEAMVKLHQCLVNMVADANSHQDRMAEPIVKNQQELNMNTKISSEMFLEAFAKQWSENIQESNEKYMSEDDSDWPDFIHPPERFLNKVMDRLQSQLTDKLTYQTRKHDIDSLYIGGKDLLGKKNLDYPPKIFALIEDYNKENPEIKMWKLMHWRAPLKVIIFHGDDKDDTEEWLTNKISSMMKMLEKINDFYPENSATEYLFVVGSWREKDEDESDVYWRWASDKSPTPTKLIGG